MRGRMAQHRLLYYTLAHCRAIVHLLTPLFANSGLSHDRYSRLLVIRATPLSHTRASLQRWRAWPDAYLVAICEDRDNRSSEVVSVEHLTAAQ